MDSYIHIDGWKANIRFSWGHGIPEYEKCGRLHGRSYAIHIKIHGTQDEKGIIVDFSLVKKILKEIAEFLDHKIIIPGKSKVITIQDESTQINIISIGKKYSFPKEDCIILPIYSTSAENLAAYVLQRFIEKIENKENIKKIDIGVDEGFGQGAVISKELN